MSDTAELPTIRYDRAGKLYYVDRLDFRRPTSWLSLEKGDDGKYTAYPFAFYEIKSGREERVSVDHELVRRYAECEGWPPIGSDEYGEQLLRWRKNTDAVRADTARTLAFYDAEVALGDRLWEQHMAVRNPDVSGSTPVRMRSA